MPRNYCFVIQCFTRALKFAFEKAVKFRDISRSRYRTHILSKQCRKYRFSVVLAIGRQRQVLRRDFKPRRHHVVRDQFADLGTHRVEEVGRVVVAKLSDQGADRLFVRIG